MAKPVYSDEAKREALHIFQNEGLAAAARASGATKTSIRRWAKSAGIVTEHAAKTAAATEAAQIDAAAVRAATAGKSIQAADKIADLILERLPIEGMDIPLKDLTTVMGILADKHVVLVKMDQGSEEHSAVDAWLEHVMGGVTGKLDA